MDDPFAQHAEDHFAEAPAKDALFQGGAAAVPTRAITARNLELTDTYGSVIVIDEAITLPRRDVGLPEPGHTVVVDGLTWRVGRIVYYDDYAVTVSTSRGA